MHMVHGYTHANSLSFWTFMIVKKSYGVFLGKTFHISSLPTYVFFLVCWGKI